MTNLHLFDAFGIEIEYMIVDRESLAVRAISDRALTAMNGGELTSDVQMEQCGWSNELVLHVLEIKSNPPTANLRSLVSIFQTEIARTNQLLQPLGCRLLPTAMHPFFDPEQETKLWPHDSSDIYDAYHRIFTCRGHGWSNLQSVHINLPFGDAKEFDKLHTAIRLVLPIIPGLAASSPIVDGKLTGRADNRLFFYFENQKRIPSIIGDVIPEMAQSPAEYEEKILQRLYRDIAPHDPDKLLQHEWLNSRGAIARFDRNAIEIRLVDAQECVRADLSVAALIIGAVESFVEESWATRSEQGRFHERELRKILHACAMKGGEAGIENLDYLRLFGFKTPTAVSAVWKEIARRIPSSCKGGNREFGHDIERLLDLGTLSQRIQLSVGEHPSHESILKTFQDLSRCLATNTFFGE